MNTQTVQKAYADFGAGNIAAILEAMDENVEWITPGTDAMSGRHSGKAGVGNFFRLVAETWSFNSFEPKQFLESGDQVVVIGSYEAKSVVTGRTASCDWVMLWTLSNGKVTRFQEFTDTAVLNTLLPAVATARA